MIIKWNDYVRDKLYIEIFTEHIYYTFTQTIWVDRNRFSFPKSNMFI